MHLIDLLNKTEIDEADMSGIVGTKQNSLLLPIDHDAKCNESF